MINEGRNAWGETIRNHEEWTKCHLLCTRGKKREGAFIERLWQPIPGLCGDEWRMGL
jgi:hypothetical protein